MPVMSTVQASQLSHAIELAAYYHRDQVDKRGEAYILHPIRVMMRLQSPEEKAMGVLHDVIEDHGIKAETLLAAGIPEVVVNGIRVLSRQDINGQREPYIDSFIRRIADNPDDRILRVKIADLEDNLDENRIPPNAIAHQVLQEKYRRAKVILEATLRARYLRKELQKTEELMR